METTLSGEVTATSILGLFLNESQLQTGKNLL